MWGIRARYDAGGQLVGEIERVRHPMPVGMGQAVARMWRDAFPSDP
jgi:hypothetical protein